MQVTNIVKKTKQKNIPQPLIITQQRNENRNWSHADVSMAPSGVQSGVMRVKRFMECDIYPHAWRVQSC